MQFILVLQKRNTVDYLDQCPHNRHFNLSLDYSQPLSNSSDFSNAFHVSSNVIFKNI